MVTEHIQRVNGTIDVKCVTKSYRTDGVRFDALREVSLTIARGEFIALVGKSGSGKSTLMNMLTGIDRPTSGEIEIFDTRVHDLSESGAAQWRGRNAGVVFQFFQLMPTMTILENVLLPMDFCNVIPKRSRTTRAMELLALCGVADQAHKFPSALSGGQQQRAAVARALANDPPLLVADEPTGNLDSATADGMYSIFKELVKGGKTLVIVSHDREISKIVDRVITITDGKIGNEEVPI